MTPLACAILLVQVAFAWKPALAGEPAEADKPPVSRIELERDDKAGRLRVLIDDQEAVVCRYGTEVDLVHYYPVRSPSGKSMTIQEPDPYPHHRSFWFADRVRLEGERDVNFYGALYSAADRGNPKPPFADHVRHVEFVPDRTAPSPNQRTVTTKLLWEMDHDKPVLEELRSMRIVALENGEYFLDFTFTVTASHGNVTFTSDATHYAWPYVRMCPEFSVEQGGQIVNSEGGVNQAGTNGKEAKWVDYVNTIDGVTEGLAVFSHTDNAQPHKWLTRDYGCFGPRRIDAKSGKPFTLKKGESLSRRVGVLVHRGDVKTGRVAKRFEAYVKGRL
jgi:hypothetical protein